MTSWTASPSALAGRPERPSGAALVGAGIVAVAGVGAFVKLFGPLALLVAPLGVLALVSLVARPSTGMLLAVALLFTNLPVVWAQQGLIPRAAAALVGLLFLPALVHHLVIRRRTPRVDRTFGLMVALLGALVISAFVAVDPGLALGRVGVFAMEGLAIYFLVVNTVRDLSALRRVIAVLVLAASVLAAVAAFQALTGSYEQDFLGMARPHPEVAQALAEGGGPRAETRVRGPVDDPNRFAQILLLVLPFSLVPVLTAKRRVRRLVAGGCGLLILGAIALTYSRGAFLTLAVLVVLAGVFRYARPSRILAGALLAALLMPFVAPGYVERVKSIGGAVGLFTDDAPVAPDAVTRGRTTEMLAAFHAFREHPVIGVGPGQYMPHYSVQYQLRPEISFRELPTPRRAHDLYVEVAAETGAVGLLIFLAIPAWLLVDLRRLRQRLKRDRPDLEPLAGAFMLGILGYLGTGVFLHLAYERYWWFFVALAGAAVAILRRELDEGAERMESAGEGFAGNEFAPGEGSVP